MTNYKIIKIIFQINFFFNFWKPKHTIEEGIDKIIDYYDK